ncbi:hypothetical protein BCM43_30040 (plasmid) [Bacillus thuringiensis]|uniref:hypothetical protein n=1 Tax=Bacillus thuringiensis TaxID=1428 RepID=UPI00080F5DCF|nr:hypothetical protein [Bacillus thuringiensis]ANV74660.1 hypothetical protein BCM43_30040 [Bacillus thuringiensis]
MKKICMLLIFVFSISILLIGCNKEKEKIPENFGLEKTGKIEVASVDNPKSVLNVIDNKDDVTEFVNRLEFDKWSSADIPSNAIKKNIYNMYQEETVKLGESNSDEKKFKQIATIITYKDSPYITLKIGKLNFNFKASKDVEK